jgi:cell division inhibitor SepF
MASGMVRRAMVYLGLVDDDYEDYEAYEEPPPPSGPRPAARPYLPEGAESGASGLPGVRTIPREEATGGSVITARPQGAMRPTITPIQNAKVHVVAPAKFSDAQEIGDRFKNGQPVILNLQNADRELARRMIDFCSGVTYALGGSMEKAADQVFLVTPTNVEVSAEEKRRLQERGLYRS